MRTINKISLKGVLGESLRRSCENRLKKVDYVAMALPFQQRSEGDNGWRCEFWGKVIRSAILTNHWLKDAGLAAKIDEGIDAILAAQTSDGCISSYPVEKQLGGWDVWGRKYVLLGLLRYYDFVEKRDDILESACRMTDHLFGQIKESGKSICETGWHCGLASCSILTAVMQLYAHTGEKRFLEYARDIVAQGCNWTHDIFEAARNGFWPSEIGNGKAYEMTSCFEGLADFWRVEPDEKYAEACRKYFEGVRQREIFITGTGGLKDRNGEYWCSGALHQTQQGRSIGMLGETCITTTWMHYCHKMIGIANESAIYDEAEKSIYNALLGAMMPDGSNWCHQNPTPLTNGCKQPTTDQIMRGFGKPFHGHDCCLAQGPEGLAFAPLFAFDADKDGTVAINLYEPMEAEFSDGIRLSISGDYPYSNIINIGMDSNGQSVPLRLRVPSFCKAVSLNGIEQPHDGFLQIERIWTADDIIP